MKFSDFWLGERKQIALHIIWTIISFTQILQNHLLANKTIRIKAWFLLHSQTSLSLKQNMSSNISISSVLAKPLHIIWSTKKKKPHTSKYIHCFCTWSKVSTTSNICDSVFSHRSTSCSKALTNLEAFIVDSETWLSSNAVKILSMLLCK